MPSAWHAFSKDYRQHHDDHGGVHKDDRNANREKAAGRAWGLLSKSEKEAWAPSVNATSDLGSPPRIAGRRASLPTCPRITPASRATLGKPNQARLLDVLAAANLHEVIDDYTSAEMLLAFDVEWVALRCASPVQPIPHDYNVEWLALPCASPVRPDIYGLLADLSGSSLPMETITYNAVEQAISGIELVAVEDFESLKLEGSMRHIMGLQERSKLAWPLAAVLAELQYAPVA